MAKTGGSRSIGVGSNRTSRGGGGASGSLDRSLLKMVSGSSTAREGREANALARSMPANSAWRKDYHQATMAGASNVNARRYADARRTAANAVMRAKIRAAGRG